MNHKIKGFSFLEVILYVAIVSVFLTVAVVFMINVLTTSSKYNAQSEVNDTLYFIHKKINYDLKNATSVAIVGSNEIIITSTFAGREEVKYTLNNGFIKFGIKDSTGCNYSNLCTLSSNLLEVVDFTFSKIQNTAGTETLVKYSIDLKYKPQNKSSKFEYGNKIEDMVVIKSI